MLCLVRLKQRFGCVCFFLVVCASCNNNSGDPELKRSSDGINESSKSSKSTKSGPKCFEIVNGRVTSQFPSVVLLFLIQGQTPVGRCTGVFVSKNTLLTASHCTMSEDPRSILYIPGYNIDTGVYAEQLQMLLRSGVHPDKVFILSKDLVADGSRKSGIYPDTVHRDLAVLLFRENIAPAVSPIISHPVKPDDEAILVGFGQTTVPESVDTSPSNQRVLVKRYGRNSIGKIPSKISNLDGTILLEGRAHSSDDNSEPTDSLAGKGDSGGPLFVGNNVAGILSAGLEREGLSSEIRSMFKGEGLNLYADLAFETAEAFLAEIEEQGATFTYAEKTNDHLASHDNIKNKNDSSCD